MSKFKIKFEERLPIEVEAETVTFEDGVVAFYKDHDPTELSSSEELVVAIKEWREVERTEGTA